jgi:prepilin-type N-terminal cleavage/methylation domain-containing protein
MFKKIKSEKGFGLVEVLVALALFGIIATAFSMGLFASSKSVLLSDNLTTAESLARTQMEDIKDASYANEYTIPLPSEFIDVGYTSDVEVDTIAAGLQRITITISHNGAEILELEGYKANR